MIVHLPFLPHFRKPMLHDKKTATCRTRQYAKDGDRFKAFGSWFLVDAVFMERLDVMRAQYAMEGCASPEEFEGIWESLHPSGFYGPRKVYVHTFHRRGATASYPADWVGIAERVKDAADWRCERCGHPHDPPAGYTLTVHHVDMDPGNISEENLAPLCQRCHLKVQAHKFPRWMWQNQIQKRLETYGD